MFRFIFVLSALVSGFIFVPDAEAHASSKYFVQNQSLYQWYGIVGSLKGGYDGPISDTNLGVVTNLLSVDRVASGVQQWSQIGLFRGSAGDYNHDGTCPAGGYCVRNLTSTPHVYTEANRYPGCFGDYFIFDWGEMSDPNMVFWNYYTHSWTDACGEVQHNYDLATTYPNGWPQKLIGGNVRGSKNGIATAAVEVHNHDAVEDTQGENCFGSVWFGICAASTVKGVHLASNVYGWLLWTPGLDPTNGIHYIPDPFCPNGVGNPYTYWPFADFYSFRGFGPIC